MDRALTVSGSPDIISSFLTSQHCAESLSLMLA